MMEVVEEKSPEQLRDAAWSKLEGCIVQYPNRRIALVPLFQEALSAFVKTHLDVLIDQHHHSEEFEPYEFIRDKLVKMGGHQNPMIFSQIRSEISNKIAMRVTNHGKGATIGPDDQRPKFYTALRAYSKLLPLRKARPSQTEKAVIELAVALANKLAFEGATSELSVDPYVVIEASLTWDDAIDKEISIASIAQKVTRILVAKVAETTEKKLRNKRPTLIPPAASSDVEERVSIQRGEGVYRYIVSILKSRLQDTDQVILNGNTPESSDDPA